MIHLPALSAIVGVVMIAAAIGWAFHALILRHLRADVLPGHRNQCGCWACNIHRMGNQKRRI